MRFLTVIMWNVIYQTLFDILDVRQHRVSEVPVRFLTVIMWNVIYQMLFDILDV